MMIRALVAEDSPTARRLIVEILQSDPQIEVVGEAETGRQALELTRRLRPDVITMDVRMPEMDGIEATKLIMNSVPTPIVIVSSTVLSDVAVSMDALAAGALAALQKPWGPGAEDFDAERERFATTIRSMAGVKVVRRWVQAERPSGDGAGRGSRHVDHVAHGGPSVPPQHPVVPPRIVAIVASTGGPAAIHRLLLGLPDGLAAPIVVVQHMARGFTAGLVNWLRATSGLDVEVATDCVAPLAGRIYFAPDDHHLTLDGHRRFRLTREPPVGGFRPSGNPLFESVAEVFGPSALAIVLTGMGEDGVGALSAVRERGGRVIAQDEASSVVYGMPAVAVERKLAHEVVGIDQLAARLLTLVGALGGNTGGKGGMR